MFDFLKNKFNEPQGKNVRQAQEVPKQNAYRAEQPKPLWLLILNMILPTVCVLLYVCLGLIIKNDRYPNGLWHPTWIIFLIVPVYYSLIESINKKKPEYFAYPVVAVAAYLLAGFLGDAVCWRTCWIILLTIPLYYIFCSAIRKRQISVILDLLIPTVCIGVYLLVGFLCSVWHPTWVIFFIIPLYFQTKEAIKKYKKQQTNQSYGQNGYHDKSDVETMTEEEYERQRRR